MFTRFIEVVYSIAEWITKFAYINILWILFTVLGLFFFGFFPATTAMFAVIRKWIHGKSDISIFKTFWSSYKKEFITSNILGLMIIIIGYIIYIDIMFVRNTGHFSFQIIYYPLLIAGMIYLLTVLYVFPVLVHYNIKVFPILKNAFLMMVTSPLLTIMMLGGIFGIYWIMITIPALIPFFSGSLLAYVVMWFCNRAFIKVERVVGEK